MPEQTQTISVQGKDPSIVLAEAYAAILALGWKVKYAGEAALVAYTPRSWNKWDDEVTIGLNAGELSITSKLVHGEVFDLRGRNKKHIAAFIASFGKTQNTGTPQQLEEWNQQLEKLRAATLTEAEEQIKVASEVEQVMNFSKSNLYLTYGIMAINALVFILMAVNGVNVLEPTGLDILNWGGNYAYATPAEWWRLLSCVFVHIGIIHLLFNMYALWMIGTFLEPMLGKIKFAAAYLCTGVFASLASLWWHTTPVVSAGASGAIFGMYGLFLAFLSTNLIPKTVRNGLLQSIGVFIVFNLVYGMKAGVDNAAHVGGLLSGAVVGYIYYFFSFRSKQEEKRNSLFPVLLIVALTAAAIFIYTRNSTAPEFINEEENTTASAFSKSIEHFRILETMAIEAMNATDTSTEENYLAEIKKTSLTNWTECVNLMDEAAKLELPSESDKLRQRMKEYAEHRVEETLLIIKAVEQDTDKYNNSIDSVRTLLLGVLDKIKKEHLLSPEKPAAEPAQ